LVLEIVEVKNERRKNDKIKERKKKNERRDVFPTQKKNIFRHLVGVSFGKLLRGQWIFFF
jgi:hypothetical protein